MKKRGKVYRNHFRVSIFGSARIKKGDPRFKIVYDLAKKLAENGIDIIIGGGPGLMDAASRGHLAGREKHKVHTIGLTIQLPKAQKRSYHLDRIKDFKILSKRLDNFVHLSNAVVVAPGGIGTLLEFFFTWQLVQVKYKRSIPIILLGKPWPGLISWIKKQPLKNKFLDKKDLNPIYLVETSDQAINLIKKTYKEYLKGNTKYLPKQ
mgnify:CR=1 FL=1